MHTLLSISLKYLSASTDSSLASWCHMYICSFRCILGSHTAKSLLEWSWTGLRLLARYLQTVPEQYLFRTSSIGRRVALPEQRTNPVWGSLPSSASSLQLEMDIDEYVLLAISVCDT